MGNTRSAYGILGDGSRGWFEIESAILSAIWTGAGTTSAPDPELYGLGQIGAASDGVAAGLTYHITGAEGARAWTATGGTVANLYGG